MNYTVEDIARVSFPYFCKKVLGMTWAPHHNEWTDLLRANDRILIECARSHGKSHFFSKAYPLWLVYSGQPDEEIVIISYSEDQAKELIRKIADEIERNPLLARLRPGTSQIWQALHLQFPWGAYIRGDGFGSAIRGAHPKRIIVDDPLKDRGGMSPEEQVDFFFGALSGMAKRDTQISVVGTPLDAGDLLEYLERNKRYVFKGYPALSETGLPLFPYLFSKEELEQKEQEIGSTAFAREFLLQRVDLKTQPFKDQFRTINDRFEFPEFVEVRTLVDPAISERERSCDSAIVTVGQDNKNQLWEIETNIMHSDDSAKLCHEMVRTVQRYSIRYGASAYAIGMEEEVFQKTIGFDFKKMCVERGIDVTYQALTHQGISGKHQRIMGLQGLWEARAIHLLPESPLIGQFRYYRPGIKGFKIDALDALSWIRDERVTRPYQHVEAYLPEFPEFVHEE